MTRSRIFLAFGALAVLFACGGGPQATPPPTPCPASSGLPSPGPGTTLRGFVFEGEGTDGRFSGRPVACATVIVESGTVRQVLETDAQGFFDTGLTPVEFTLHVLPPAATQAAAVSLYDLRTTATGQVVRVYLPLRRPVGGPVRDPGSSLVPAVAGRVLDREGAPQVGAYPPGGAPGDPDSTGFVWWGVYGGTAGGRWVDSGITDSEGRFTLWSSLGGERLGRTRPFFAGNYDGRSPGRDVLFFTQYSFQPAVDVLVGQPADLGTVRMSAVDGQLVVQYDAAAREVLASWGPNGLGFTYLLARVSVAAEDLEVARAFNGPYQGQLQTDQTVPVPQVAVGPSQYLHAVSFAFDATVLDNTGELAVTWARSGDGRVVLSYLSPPRNFQWEAQARRFTWATSLEATLYEVNLRDPDNLPVWLGLRGAGQNAATVPFALPAGRYFAYVYANDAETPATRGSRVGRTVWRLSGRAGRVGRNSGAPLRPSHVTAFQSGQERLRESFSRTLVFSAP